MDRRLRDLYNSAYSEDLFNRYVSAFEKMVGTTFPFRLAETPVFLPSGLRAQLETAATEIVDQLSRPETIEAMKRAIPREWDTPGLDSLPSLTQVDFAIVRDANGELAPRLIELQGFPSLTGMQVFQRDAWMEAMSGIPGLDGDFSCWFSGLSRSQFIDLARRTIVGDHDPEEVVLLDLDPPTQKTYPDFAATRKLFGVDPVDPSELTKRGRELWRERNGKSVRVRRIYNRVVFDELLKKGTRLPFDYREELDVEWAPHPNWYWIWSKYSLPFLDHPTVPRASFLSDLGQIPDDLSNYVLKPLFSFAGAGVNVDPTAEDIRNIPDEERRSWCIQEKITYEPALIATDGGGVKVEIRMMFLRPDDVSRPVLAQNLCRLSRGKMLGVDFNKDYTWVGSSVGLWEV